MYDWIQVEGDAIHLRFENLATGVLVRVWYEPSGGISARKPYHEADGILTAELGYVMALRDAGEPSLILRVYHGDVAAEVRDRIIASMNTFAAVKSRTR